MGGVGRGKRAINIPGMYIYCTRPSVAVDAERTAQTRAHAADSLRMIPKQVQPFLRRSVLLLTTTVTSTSPRKSGTLRHENK